MNLVLSRTDWTKDGIFGTLSGDGSLSLYTLEHAYPSKDDPTVFSPKVPIGTYNCVRGFHHLEKYVMPIETFEITGVPWHTGVLFHVGNYNMDSDGCVLLGWAKGDAMILNSEEAFEDFMKMQQGCDDFVLTVT